MKTLSCALILSLGLCIACEHRDAASIPGGSASHSDNDRRLPIWATKFSGPPSGTRLEEWDSFVNEWAEEISRDDSHVDVLRNVFANCTKEEAGWATQVLVRLAERDPKPEYLELSDLLLARPDIGDKGLLSTVYFHYPASAVSDRFASILSDKKASLGDKLVAIRMLAGMAERGECAVIRRDLDSVTSLIVDEPTTDSFLVLETLILRRSCDLILNEDCLKRLDAVLAREGPDFRKEWVTQLRKLCSGE